MTGSTAETTEATGLFAPVKRLYQWVLSFADSPWGPAALFAFAFIESSFFPIPPDPLLIALCLGAVNRSLRLAAICTLASVLGGMLGYAIGMFGFDIVGRPIVEFYGRADLFDSLAADFRSRGDLAVLVAALTPVPYKLVTITAGAVGMSVPSFLFASAVGRGTRFFGVAALIWWKGEVIASFIDRYFELLTVAFSVLLVGGIVAFRFLLAH